MGEYYHTRGESGEKKRKTQRDRGGIRIFSVSLRLYGEISGFSRFRFTPQTKGI
jgi:hypothetical protein